MAHAKENTHDLMLLELLECVDTESFLHRCMRSLSKSIPVDGMALFVYSTKDHSMTLISEVLNGHIKHMSTKIIIPKEIIYDLSKSKKVQHNSITTINTPVQILDIQEDQKLFNVMKTNRGALTSNIRINIHVDEQLHYFATIYTFGTNRYTPEHLKIASKLHTPLSYLIKHKVFEPTSFDGNAPSQAEDAILRNYTNTFLSSPLPGMNETMHLVRRAALTDVPVLILGETGVGKEIVANSIQQLSNRKDRPFVKINCGAIPESLIDSELFGHEKGAFTGAHTHKIGKFELAQGGTVFLDEIGELPLALQARLLRVLQFKEVERVGGSSPVKLNVRIIAATHRDLHKLAVQGHFREDLWFRLNIFPLQIPPLRKRQEDITELAQRILSQKCQEMRLPKVPRIGDATIARFLVYPWPGNVRELENCIWRNLITQPLSDILECELPEEHASKPLTENIASEEFLSLDSMIALYIDKVLHHTKGRVHGKGGAAEILGVNPSTLRSRIKKLGI